MFEEFKHFFTKIKGYFVKSYKQYCERYTDNKFGLFISSLLFIIVFAVLFIPTFAFWTLFIAEKDVRIIEASNSTQEESEDLN